MLADERAEPGPRHPEGPLGTPQEAHRPVWWQMRAASASACRSGRPSPPAMMGRCARFQRVAWSAEVHPCLLGDQMVRMMLYLHAVLAYQVGNATRCAWTKGGAPCTCASSSFFPSASPSMRRPPPLGFCRSRWASRGSARIWSAFWAQTLVFVGWSSRPVGRSGRRAYHVRWLHPRPLP